MLVELTNVKYRKQSTWQYFSKRMGKRLKTEEQSWEGRGDIQLGLLDTYSLTRKLKSLLAQINMHFAFKGRHTAL